MSSIRGESYTLDTTGEVIADGGMAGTSSPNEVLVRVTSGDILIGGAEADALFPVGIADGAIPINLTAGDELWAKGDGGAATVKVFRTKGA